MRKIAGWVAVAAALPYITLKTLWVAGIGVGVNDQSLMKDAEMVAANAFTGGLEVVGVIVALAFLMPWGRRLPSWLVLFPTWVGTGLLAPIAVMLPIALSAELLRPGTLSSSDALDAWVPWVVYGGFTVQALALLTAFAFYARERWGGVLRGAVSQVATGPTHKLQTLLAFVAIGLAAGTAIPAVLGLGSGAFNEILQRVVAIVLAVLTTGGLLMLVRVWRGATWPAVVVTWLGSAGLFATGSLMLLLNLVTVVAGQTPEPMDTLSLVQLLAGTLAGTVAAFALTERDWEARVAD